MSLILPRSQPTLPGFLAAVNGPEQDGPLDKLIAEWPPWNLTIFNGRPTAISVTEVLQQCPQESRDSSKPHVSQEHREHP